MQRLLPVLSTYLGHSKLRHTQVYLSITPELLQQAQGLGFTHRSLPLRIVRSAAMPLGSNVIFSNTS